MSRWTSICVLLFAFQVTPCWAVIVLEKDNSESIKGFLVSQNDSRVVVDELLPNGETRQRVIPRSSIDVMIVSVALDRLEALRPEQPRDYRDYADELSEKREDPEARNVAIRLYLLAASLDPAGQGRSALLSMAGLARSIDEERKFRAMAYLLDPAHDRSVLSPPSFTDVPPAELTSSQRTMLLSALRALRGGDRREALAYSRRALFQQVFGRYSTILSIDAFRAAATEREKELPNAILKKLITLELLILNQPIKDRPTGGSGPWSSLLATKKDFPATALSLSSVTEFNPSETVFKDNRWSVAE